MTMQMGSSWNLPLVILKLCFIPVVIFLSDSLSLAQENESVIRAARVEEAVVLDGILSETDWQKAIPISDFTQRELREGEPATERTEVRVLYNKDNLYFGVICHDSEPEKIIHNELKRDGNIDDDDNIAIVLDTYRDFRSGYYFETNPNGARGDALISNVEHTNNDWNGVWDAAARITDTGWSAEIVIPFKTLRFPEREESVWGFNVLRGIRRKQEEVLWRSWLRNDGLLQLSRAGILAGLANIAQGGTGEVKPYGLGGREVESGKPINTFKYGADARYPITSTLTLDLTAYTDFAQVEADQTEINLTRFDIEYPEKREFFLEGAEIFGFAQRGGSVFYTRRIGITSDRRQVPIIGGARLSGKIGGYRVGVLNMQTGGKYGYPGANYSVARIKKDMLEKSYIGLMATGLFDADNHRNQAVGADFSYSTSSFRGNNNFIVTGALSNTFTDGRGKNSLAAYLKIDYPNDHADHFFEYILVPRGFNPEVGFIPRKDMIVYRTRWRFMPRPNISGVKQISIEPLALDYLTDTRGRLMTREAGITPIGVELKSGDEFNFGFRNAYEYLEDDFNIFGDAVIGRGSYDWWFYDMQIESNRGRRISGEYRMQWGNFYTGKRTQLEPEAMLKLNKNIAVSTVFNYNHISVPGASFTTEEYGGRLTLNFSTRLTSRTFVQWNNDDKQFFVNFLINFIPKIGSDIYFVYNQIWDGEHGYVVRDRTGIAKIAYLFRF